MPTAPGKRDPVGCGNSDSHTHRGVRTIGRCFSSSGTWLCAGCFECSAGVRLSPRWRRRSSTCWVTQRPSGFELHARYSIRRVVGRGNERLSDTSSARSARVSFGRTACRRRIASSWRWTRISNSFERHGRPNSHTSANRFRTTRYINDQSKRPSLDHGKAPNLATSTLRESRGRVREPYALVGYP